MSTQKLFQMRQSNLNTNSVQPDKIDQPNTQFIIPMSTSADPSVSAELVNNNSKHISNSMLQIATNEYIIATEAPIDSLENTKQVDLTDPNSNIQHIQNHIIQGLNSRFAQDNTSIGSVDYSDDDLEVDRDEETRNQPELAQDAFQLPFQLGCAEAAEPDQVQAENDQENFQKTQISTIPEDDAEGQDEYSVSQENQ